MRQSVTFQSLTRWPCILYRHSDRACNTHISFTSQAMPEPTPRLSVIIPAYNEAGRIAETLQRLTGFFSERDIPAELIVVDDGSTDGTAEVIADRFRAVRCLRYERNRGKGYASRRGAEIAHGAHLLVYDADGSTPIEETDKLWPAFESGADVVVGSRALPESNVEVPQPKHRRLMGRVYNRVLRALRLTTLRDTQCGFKAFTAEAAERIFPRLTVDGFGADCEMLVAAREQGLAVREIPIRWINSSDTRVRPFKHSLAMLREVLLVRVRAWAGRYR